MPDIDFKHIRSFGSPASPAGGFEELACILVERAVKQWPQGTVFERFGNPDGGREGRATLPDGKVWAWQVKHLFEFNSTAAGQVERSFKRVLETEAALSRYLVVFPIDLPAGDTQERSSAHTRWIRKSQEWEEMASQSGQSVEFEFIDQHQLSQALMDPEHSGLLRYWFDESFMDHGWFQDRLERVLVKAGPRYSPELHVGVEAVDVLEGLGRTDQFESEWREALAALRRQRLRFVKAPEDDDGEIAALLDSARTSVQEADGAVSAVISSFGGLGPLPNPDDQIQAAVGALRSLIHADRRPENESYTWRTLYVLEDLLELATSVATRAARSRQILVQGRAGTGKTHLFCDIAARRVEAGLPTLLVMGQDFDRRALSQQIPGLTSFRGTIEEEVAALAAAAEASGTIGLLMIDALNESERPESWKEELRVLQQIVARYDQVAIAVSCRSEFVPDVVGETSMPTMTHEGFGEATEAAVIRYAQEYGLEVLSFPVLNPEFSNPLFLKLACEALKTLGHDRFPLGSAGLTAVCEAFLEAVNQRLSAPDRCDFDRERNLVQKATRALAIATLNEDQDCFENSIDEQTATQLFDDFLQRPEWSKSLMKGLLDEGVLIRTKNPSGEEASLESSTRIAFGYQRLGDIEQSALLCEGTTEEIVEWVNGLGLYRWLHSGVLSALALKCPETKKVELFKLLADEDGRISDEDLEPFIESLVLRSTESISSQSIHVLEQILRNDNYIWGTVYDKLIQLSCIPFHSLNAEWLHIWLMQQRLPIRDTRWSQFLVGQTEEPTTVRRLMAWARDGGDDAEPEVRRLAGLTLGWMLATSDNRVRDQATKALVALLETDPDVARDVLRTFHGVDDPYVVERLAGVACGIALRSPDPSAHHLLADGVVDLFGPTWPTHLLARDFAHRVFQLALRTGWEPPDAVDSSRQAPHGPPYGAQLPTPTRTAEEISSIARLPELNCSSIWSSLDEFHGDFGKYILNPALECFAVLDEQELVAYARCAILERTLELGWTSELFKEIDMRRSSSCVERIGKKYQWIGFYELLGCLADNYLVRDCWSDREPVPYEFAEQVVWRDIDPTILSQKPRSLHTDQLNRWFSPHTASFDPEETGKEPENMNGVPDPIDFIAVHAGGDVPWLILETHQHWDEPLPSELRALDVPELHIWMQVRSYMIPSAASDDIRDWVMDEDWYGRWMPEAAEVHNAFLAVHPSDSQWQVASGILDPDTRRGRLPHNLLTSSAWYSGTGTNRDCSAPEETQGLVPSKALYDLLDLSRMGDFVWVNGQGVVTAMDPSIAEGGPTTLLVNREELVSRLAEQGRTIFWTVLVGKDLIYHDGRNPYPAKWVSASGAYILERGNVDLIYGTARLSLGSDLIQTLPWQAQLKTNG